MIVPPLSVAGDTAEDRQLWHSYFDWPRSVLTRKTLPKKPEFRRLPISRSRHLQAIVFTAFALEYRLKRVYDVLGVRYRRKDMLGALLGNFRRRIEVAVRMDKQGNVQLPAEWDSIVKRLEKLTEVRNQIAHANYKKLLTLIPSDRRRSRALARRYYNTLVDAVRVTNRAIGYEGRSPRDARRYYSTLKIR